MKFVLLLGVLGLHGCSALRGSPSYTNSTSGKGVERDLQARIVGGEEAKRGEFPYFVQGRGCGASLVWKDIILSAAHCQGSLQDDDEGGVLIGSATSRRQTKGSEWRNIATEVPHPLYNPGTMVFDFLIAKLEKPVEIDFLETIEIVDDGDERLPAYLKREPVTAMGFGTTSEGASTSETLQKVNLRTESIRRCQRLYKKARMEVDSKSMICAGARGGGKDTCQGDSGGPLVWNGKQVGVTSWGNGCGNKAFPGLYGKTFKVRDWIKEHICLLSDDPPSDCSSVITQSFTRIDLTTDPYPWETSYTLKEKDSGNVAHTVDLYAMFLTFGEHKTTNFFELKPATTYLLTVRDSFGDGMESGRILVHQISPDQEPEQLVKASLEFKKNKKKFEFTTPAV